ncbi:MAG: oxygen-dependent coproporphyrinogen oxidase [Blastocatellia bacterium]|nr:oxygen-dependent coproporphyrinogen oxidase [Blastocatellia bacterium]
MSTNQTLLLDRARTYFANLQDEICHALENLDGQATFREDVWERPGGGGGRTRVIEAGRVFEKGGVNFSYVFGDMPEKLASKMAGSEGLTFAATGVSLVLHPRNPMVPTVHANFRFFQQKTTAWFGGGADLTPYYPYREDAVHFHRTLKAACDGYDPDYYPRFKKWCDEYFYLPHRRETRGVGGLFFDYLKGTPEELEHTFAFVQGVGNAFLPAYLPIAAQRHSEPFTEAEREHQLLRRGRYVEFNLVYDRGTLFGLETNGRTESILMSLPPLARWSYDYQPAPGSREAEAMDFYRPHDWLSEIEN